MKRLFLFGLVCATTCALAVLARPTIASRQNSSPVLLLSGAHASPHVLSVIERSCQNCHSQNTEWPFYSRIFPFSWLIERDVREARAHMDLSRWRTYGDDEKGRILSEIGSVVRGHIMPPRRYTLIHPAAKLSQSEVNEIYNWTRADRRLLTRSPDPL